MSDSQRVVIVGAGLAGLTAAASAARAGAAVTLLDARDHPGGRARTQELDGFLLNQGAHALYRGGPAWSILTSFGIQPRGHAPDTAGGWGWRSDGRFDVLPATPSGLLRSSLVGWRAKLAVSRVLARPDRLPATVEPGTSMDQWIERRTANREARLLLAMLGRVSTYCGDLSGLDATAGVAQLVQALTHGVVYLDGGWQQLVDGLRTATEQAGATVYTHAKVDAVDVSPRGVTVRTAAGDFDADAVVLAAGGPTDADAVLQGASHAVRQWAAQERPVVAAALDVGLRALPVPGRRLTLGIDEPSYLSVHTPFAELAPNGGEVVHLLWYGDAPGSGSPERRDSDHPRGRLEALFDRAQPGWRQQVIAERYGRRLVVAHGRPEPGRGISGRPPAVVPDLPRVFVAGDWVAPDGLLADAAMASGRAAAVAALDELSRIGR